MATETIPSYTEQVDLDDIAVGPLAERRDEQWASYNEDQLINGTKLIGLFARSSTKATCGSSKCFLSVRTDGPQSSYNIEDALEKLAKIGQYPDGTLSLTSNKVYSMRRSDGSTVFTIQLLKAD